ncbi:ARF GTPase-activating protein GIT2 [Orchesella cincta]|uniref:ARF GTPase-activating protein GIT2 n=1 Tax=Orchesella cincta TaxID=48709 RepID=A0A1D2NFQ9_ORCCI|nr:ARF GTPase-activating protein GIT2 [Orchesella cincta]
MGDLKVGNGSGPNICGDCTAPDAEWASLNRGILLCKDCSFIHRSLGPQYSRVKFLKDAGWKLSLRYMVMTLAAGPGNHVWEHLLLNPNKSSDGNVKKPSPSDALEVKRKFIHLKHFLHQFVLRPNSDPFDVRNQELHSTVRTGALDTTLRLLASGADPNFFHPEKGTTPIHVAARNGQAHQVELLFLHGAHMDAADYLGQTPVEHALAAGHKDLAQRIMELRYFLTDQLSYFVCNENPDHSTSKHILIPAVRVTNSKQEEALKNLPATVLEQLAADLYDEVDRRQLEKYVSATIKPASDFTKFSIAFLPVNPNYSSVRNQTRQKFARLSNDELCALITLVLVECKRRHCNGARDIELDKDIFLHGDKHLSSSMKLAGETSVTEDDDYPLYDSVASDEDLILAEQQTILAQQRATFEETALSSSIAKPISSCEITEHSSIASSGAKISEMETKIQELHDDNQNLKQEINVLKNMVVNAIRETVELKTDVHGRSSYSLNGSLSNGHAVTGSLTSPAVYPNGRFKSPRPSSMCESGSLRYDDAIVPIRTCTTEASLGKFHPDLGKSELIQTTTKKIVELIKVLIEQANASDLPSITRTSEKIYLETHEMATALLLKDDECTPEMRHSLENVLLQVLRMKCEVPLLRDSTDGNGKITSQVFLQKVKRLCFDVGAGMKQLVSTVLNPGT